MYTAELRFAYVRKIAIADRHRAIESLLGALCRNGQILDSGFSAAAKRNAYHVFVSLPERAAWQQKHANRYVRQALEELAGVGLTLKAVVHGHHPESAGPCPCRRRTWLVLFTSFVSAEPPLRCGYCFGVVPLYRAPPTDQGTYYDVLCWQTDYRACDQLQMGCSTGERFATAQMSDHASSLSLRGRDICRRLTCGGMPPVYYYLYRDAGRSHASEIRRACPACGSRWLIEPPACELFDMKCDKCRLVSNIAWNVRE